MKYRTCRRRQSAWRWLRRRLREQWAARQYVPAWADTPEDWRPRPGTYYGHYGI